MMRAVVVLSVMLVGCGAVEGNDEVDSGVVVDAGVDAGVADAGVEIVDAGMTMDAGMECTPDTWANFGQQFIQQRCNTCHGFSQASVRTQRAEVISRIESNDMPRGSSLTTAQKTRVLTWLNCGAN